jgi:hypothetical protein
LAFSAYAEFTTENETEALSFCCSVYRSPNEGPRAMRDADKVGKPLQEISLAEPVIMISEVSP